MAMDDTDLQIVDHGCTVELTPRMRRIIRWLLRNQTSIEEPTKVAVTFDCAGSSVQVKRIHLDDVDCD